MNPYDQIATIIEIWAQKNYFADFIVTLSLDGSETTELLLCCEYARLEWLDDWYEGQKDIKLLGFRPVPEIVVHGAPQQGEKLQIESSRID